jgi:hypothetical protein
VASTATSMLGAGINARSVAGTDLHPRHRRVISRGRSPFPDCGVM